MPRFIKNFLLLRKAQRFLKNAIITEALKVLRRCEMGGIRYETEKRSGSL
jgi:hypothetical protein